MASERNELHWETFDVGELNADTQALYHASKEAYRAYKTARDAFENAMQADYREQLGADKELKFGYNFGKLSIAIGPKTQRKMKAETKLTLAEFLAAQAESGR